MIKFSPLNFVVLNFVYVLQIVRQYLNPSLLKNCEEKQLQFYKRDSWQPVSVTFARVYFFPKPS